MALPFMVEGAVNGIVTRMREAFNAHLDAVAAFWAASDPAPIGLPHVPPDRYYVADGVQTFYAPAVFINPDRSGLGGETILKQDHQVLVGLVVEGLTAEVLQRMAWRYAQAAWVTLHDRDLGLSQARVLITTINYGPTFMSRSRERTFRKDVTLVLTVKQWESPQ